MEEFFAFVGSHLHIDLVLALLDKPVVILEVSVYFACKRGCEGVESASQYVQVKLLQFDKRGLTRILLRHCRCHTAEHRHFGFQFLNRREWLLLLLRLDQASWGGTLLTL